MGCWPRLTANGLLAPHYVVCILSRLRGSFADQTCLALVSWMVVLLQMMALTADVAQWRCGAPDGVVVLQMALRCSRWRCGAPDGVALTANGAVGRMGRMAAWPHGPHGRCPAWLHGPHGRMDALPSTQWRCSERCGGVLFFFVLLACH